MSATRTIASRLETLRPDALRKGYHSTTLLDRLAEADAENEQRERWLAMWKDAERKPAALYEFTRAADRRAAIADNRQRKMVQAGLADGSISVERYLDYRLWQIRTDLKHVPGTPEADDVSFSRFGKEAVEGIDAAAALRCDPTTGSYLNALEQLDELIAAAHLHAATIRQARG
jgi:hypothetical protein